ncbi:hypothetical protein [Tenacibaculum finnmarkense]|uniref:hypothetical protein n=1 Tax=Tenacibaculum finnmarkense TaxID=2781243 RepID=UPI00187BBD85|nr:hypothetical protein [Tenacibaculum finnmarkense]MBE7692063.1 hypothetical protein [Tenacibaculum finnmarkense genomovar finnmarkense]
MKKVILVVAITMLSTYTLRAEETVDDCFETAIESLELAEEKYGMMSDGSATDYLNSAYSNCVTWMETN